MWPAPTRATTGVRGFEAHANRLNEFGGLAWVIGAWAVMVSVLVLPAMGLFLNAT